MNVCALKLQRPIPRSLEIVGNDRMWEIPRSLEIVIQDDDNDKPKSPCIPLFLRGMKVESKAAAGKNVRNGNILYIIYILQCRLSEFITPKQELSSPVMRVDFEVFERDVARYDEGAFLARF